MVLLMNAATATAIATANYKLTLHFTMIIIYEIIEVARPKLDFFFSRKNKQPQQEK